MSLRRILPSLTEINIFKPQAPAARYTSTVLAAMNNTYAPYPYGYVDPNQGSGRAYVYDSGQGISKVGIVSFGPFTTDPGTPGGAYARVVAVDTSSSTGQVYYAGQSPASPQWNGATTLAGSAKRTLDYAYNSTKTIVVGPMGATGLITNTTIGEINLFDNLDAGFLQYFPTAGYWDVPAWYNYTTAPYSKHIATMKNDNFVYIAGDRITTSPDGVTWTTPFTLPALYLGATGANQYPTQIRVEPDNGLIVACNNKGWVVSTNNGGLWSYFGTNTIAAGFTAIKDIYVKGTDIYICGTTSNGKIGLAKTSYVDPASGPTFAVTHPFTGTLPGFQAIGYVRQVPSSPINEYFIAVADDAAKSVVVSQDGLNWTRPAAPGPSSGLTALGWGATRPVTDIQFIPSLQKVVISGIGCETITWGYG